MASTYVNDLRLEEIGTGEQTGTWGATTNTNLELIAEAFSYGTEAITTNADTHATVIADGATDEGRSFYLKYTGTLDSECTITISAGSAGTYTMSKVWVIENATSGSQNIVITSGSGTDVTIKAGQTKMLYTDGAGSTGAVVDAFKTLSVVDLFVDDDLKLQSDGAILGFGADNDVTLTHVADTGLLLNSSRQLQFGDSGTYIHQSADGVLDLVSDTEIEINATTIDINGAVEISGTITGASTLQATTITATTAVVPDASDGAALGTTSLEWSDLYLADGAVIGFGADQDDGVLDLVSDTEIEINATTIDINGNVDISGSLILGGATISSSELEAIDGDTSATSTTLADADRVVVNDNGTMVQVALTDFETYFESALDTLSNVTTVGALDSGSITSGFGSIDTGSSTITTTGAITGGSLVADNITIDGTEIDLSSGDLTIDVAGDIILDAGGANITFKDDGTSILDIANNSSDVEFTVSVADKNFAIKGTDGASAITALDIDMALAGKATFNGDVVVGGDLTVTGDDITMGTNTAGNLLIADGTNFNSIAVGSLSEISTVANDDVFLAVDTSGGGLKKIARSAIVSGLATSSAISNVVEDTTPQLGGDLDVNGQDIVSLSNGNITITPNGSGVVRLDGNVDIQSGLIDLKNSGAVSKIKFYCESSNAHAQILQGAPHSEAASNTLTLPSTGGDVKLVSTASTATLTNKTFGDNVSFGDNNITNVGDIALDSISADGTDINVAVSDNSATAFTIKQGSDNYLVIDTANSSESVAIGTGISGTAISIGHSTSETTINDNLTVTGDLTVNGATTTVDTTNLAVKDTLLGLNQGAGSNSNDVGIIIERGSTGNDALFMWDESEDKFALGTTTSNASSTGNLNMTTGTLVANIEGNVTGNVTGNTSGTAATVTGAAQSNITSLGTLTTLTVDNVIINGTTIGHTDDTDLITLADGIATVAGEISVTTLDIGGTNVTSTAAELNILDGVTSTAAELNIMDGNTAASSTTLADADRLVTNDAGTMKQVALTDVKTYLTSAGFSTDDPTALAIALG